MVWRVLRTVIRKGENGLVFSPTTATTRWQNPKDLVHEDIELCSGDGTGLHAWWCPTEHWQPSEGALLFCHGNGGNLSDRALLVKRLQRPPLRQAVLIFDYPGYGRSKGRPTETGCYRAAEAAYHWLTKVQEVAEDRLLLFGESLGGAVAVYLASEKPHRALVLVKTFTTLPDVAAGLVPFLPVRWIMRNRFDSLSRIRQCHRPLFMAHGTADTVVPLTLGERLFRAANEPKVFLLMEGANHSDSLSHDFPPKLAEFLAHQAPI